MSVAATGGWSSTESRKLIRGWLHNCKWICCTCVLLWDCTVFFASKWYAHSNLLERGKASKPFVVGISTHSEFGGVLGHV